jgi:hypothetical protein
MERYIGLDVHAASTTFAVVGESGKRLGTPVVETNLARRASLRLVSKPVPTVTHDAKKQVKMAA